MVIKVNKVPVGSYQINYFNHPMPFHNCLCKQLVKFIRYKQKEIQCFEKLISRKQERIKKISQRRWLQFRDRIINSAYHVKFEVIKGTANHLADLLSRLLLQEHYPP